MGTGRKWNSKTKKGTFRSNRTIRIGEIYVRRIALAIATFVIAMTLALGAQSAVSAQSSSPPAPQGPASPASLSRGTHSGLDFPTAHKAAHPSKDQAPTELFFDASQLGSPILLEKGWRVGITSDPAAARTDFDDSKWAVRDAVDAIPDIEEDSHGDHHANDSSDDDFKFGAMKLDSGPQKYAWFRLHIKLPVNHGPVYLMVELPTSRGTTINISSSGPGFDIFANGNRIHPEGPHADTPEHYEPISRIYDLKVPADETSLILGVRTIYRPFGYGAYTSFFANRKLRLGHREELDRALELWNVHGLFERLPRIVISILLLVLAMFLFALYFTQKGHPEYLWLGLHELVMAPLAFIELAGSSAYLDSLWYVAIYFQLFLISAYLYFEFLIAFLSLRRRWYIWFLRYSSPILLGVAPTTLMVGHSTLVGILLAGVMLFAILWITAWTIFVFLTLIVATVRRNFEAGLLLIPLVLSLVGMMEPILIAAYTSMGHENYRSPLTIQAGLVPIHFAAIADFVGILVIVLIIFVRFLRINRDQERASSELAAARSVQELMIPQETIQTPGFEVESIYTPANEVGGDFFHVQSTGDGGLLVVLGDVAGKGLRAAMNVSMLMGALRRTMDRSPGRILESLNRVLVGGDSFTTCQAVWFKGDGEVVMANAGHLPPYLNSQEVALPGGLPLGFLPEVTYEEVLVYLHPGDRLLLMSDGVVEARGSSGELFGFDRVHNLSGQSAFYIADAAKTFGQEDDITVLTVRRLAQAMAA
jgi:hypothetical protein